MADRTNKSAVFPPWVMDQFANFINFPPYDIAHTTLALPTSGATPTVVTFQSGDRIIKLSSRSYIDYQISCQSGNTLGMAAGRFSTVPGAARWVSPSMDRPGFAIYVRNATGDSGNALEIERCSVV